MFNGASNFTIHDGAFTQIAGNATYNINGNFYGEVIVASSTIINAAHFGGSMWAATRRLIHKLDRIKESWDGVALDGTLKYLHDELDHLREIVGMVETMQGALRGTVLGQFMRRQVGLQVTQCEARLASVADGVHSISVGAQPALRELVRSQRLPIEIANRILFHDLGDVEEMRNAVAVCTEELSRWLYSLKSFKWATALFFVPDTAAGSSMLFNDLDGFFQRGPPSLRHIHDDPIYVEDPFGQTLTIPGVYASSLEHIHMCLQERCRNTAGRRYIENRDYELNEGTTDEPVHGDHFQDVVHAGVVLKVAIVVAMSAYEASKCPQCGNVGDARASEHGWIRCDQCLRNFRIDAGDGESRVHPPSTDNMPAPATDRQPQDAPDSISLDMFQRLKIIALSLISSTQEPEVQGTIEDADEHDEVDSGWDITVGVSVETVRTRIGRTVRNVGNFTAVDEAMQPQWPASGATGTLTEVLDMGRRSPGALGWSPVRRDAAAPDAQLRDFPQQGAQKKNSFWARRRRLRNKK